MAGGTGPYGVKGHVGGYRAIQGTRHTGYRAVRGTGPYRVPGYMGEYRAI